MNPLDMKAPKDNLTVILKRTFNQNDFQGGYIKFWRVIGPLSHPNINSDLSALGLKAIGVIPKGDI
jgi:hypothetical protein